MKDYIDLFKDKRFSQVLAGYTFQEIAARSVSVLLATYMTITMGLSTVIVEWVGGDDQWPDDRLFPTLCYQCQRGIPKLRCLPWVPLFTQLPWRYMAWPTVFMASVACMCFHYDSGRNDQRSHGHDLRFKYRSRNQTRPVPECFQPGHGMWRWPPVRWELDFWQIPSTHRRHTLAHP